MAVGYKGYSSSKLQFKMIRLSIIVPFYNVEKYIEQCIRSLYDQDIPQEEYEVICVDDCSPDGSRAIVEQLQTEFPTLQLIIHERNKKLGGARNTGLRAAKGEYIWFVDSDDYLMPNVVQMLLKEAELLDLDILHFNFWEDRPEGFRFFNKKELYESDVMLGRDFFFRTDGQWWQNNVIVWQKLFRRMFLLQHDLYFVEDIMFEDNDFAIRTFSFANRVKHISLQAYVYRYNSSSITRTSVDINKLFFLTVSCVSLASNMDIIFENGGSRIQNAAIDYIKNTISSVCSNLKKQDIYNRLHFLNRLGICSLIRLKSYLSLRQWLSLIGLH